MAYPLIPHNVGSSPAKAEKFDDAPPVPLSAPPPDPEKAGADANQHSKAEPGAKWKNNEVQEIPKKCALFEIA